MTKLSTIVRPIRKRPESPVNNPTPPETERADAIDHPGGQASAAKHIKRNPLARLLDRFTPALDITFVDLNGREVMADLDYGRDVD